MDETKEEMLLMIGHAKRCLASAWLLFTNDDYPSAINRAYYCVFHCARALLADDQSVDFRKHSAVIGEFRKKFVKTEIFEKRLSNIIGGLFEERNGSDYNDLYFIDREKTEARLNDADYFLRKVCEHLGIDTSA